LRNLTKSAEEKRQETVAAYLDEVLTGRARQQFEQEMAQDESLRHEVAQLLLIKQSLRQLPQREVPRNFILDPAKYGRPARQPWVQAYPVLRAATAMTAFFLIFAFAAGIFTNLGRAEPAADVAQVEATSVERETTETLAFEAEAGAMTEEEAEEPAAEEAADESTLEESVDLFEEEMEEAAEEMAEEEATPSPEATAVPSPADSLQGDTVEDGATVAEPIVQPTPTISPTPTVSTLPRVTPPTPLPERDMDQAAGGEAANEAVAEVSEMEDDTTTAETTAVLPEEDVQELDGGLLFDPLLVLQIGLGVLLLLLAGFTLYARRQR
jgi:hypothetical protein